MKTALIFLLFSLSAFLPRLTDAKQRVNCFDYSNQTEMNDCFHKELEGAEQNLDQLYQKILNLNSDEPLFIKRFEESQNAWIQYRDAELELMFPVKKYNSKKRLSPSQKTAAWREKMQNYGSIFPTCYARERSFLTIQRYQELKRFADGTQEGDVCAGSVKIISD